MARKKKDTIEQNDVQVIEQENKENKEQNKEDIIVPDQRTLEQKLNSYKRKLRRI